MSFGAPDWLGLRWKVETTLRPTLVYSTGKAIIYDDFTGGNLKWNKDGTGTIATLTTESFSNSSCMKLSATSEFAGEVLAQRWFGNLATQVIGLELKFALKTADLEYFTIGLYSSLAGAVITPLVRYDTVNNKWQYLDSAAVWQDIADSTMSLPQTTTVWQFAKLIVNVDTRKYVSLNVNEKEFDLTGISVLGFTPDPIQYQGIEVGTSAVYGKTTYAYVDDVVVTQED